MILEVEHRLEFRYDAYIRESFIELRVEPRRSARQTLHEFHLAVGPPTQVWRYVDWNGNFVHHFGILDFHDRIEVVTRSIVETRPSPEDWDAVAAREPVPPMAGSLLDFTSFGGPVRRSPALETLAREIPAGDDAPLVDQVRAVSALVYGRFEYRTEVTSYRSTSDHILEAGAGVCQDFSHLTLALLRLRGIPCRYVGGYLHDQDGNGGPLQGHAWIEFHSAAAGWLALDPTHDCVPDGRYVILAYGRSYEDVPPNRGIFRGIASEALSAEVRTREVPRPEGLGTQDETSELDVPAFRSLPRGEIPPGSEREPEVDAQQQQ